MILLQLGREKLNGIRKTITFKDMNRIDGMPTEFEWKMFPGIMTLGLLEKIQSLMRDLQCEPEHFIGRIIFMSMHNDIAWGEKGNRQLRNMLANSLVVIGLSWCLDQKRKWYGSYTGKTRRIVESISREHDGKFLRIRTSNISCL